MRDILFRGKTVGDNGKFVYGNLIHVDDYCCILERKEDLHPMDEPYLDGEIGWIDGKATPVIPETVGQSTGVYDKNARLIFDGDIVRAMMDWGPGGMLESTVDIGFKIFEGYRWNYFVLDTIEIIGNVYENPELVEGRKREKDFVQG